MWSVGPLDGTKEFIKQNGEFTVNIALIHNSKPVIGITVVPVIDVIYLGWVGIGAYKIKIQNGLENSIKHNDLENILTHSDKLSPAKINNSVTIVISRSPPDGLTNKLVQLLSEEGIVANIINRGSALKFGLVAAGTADIYARSNNSYEWDTASGDALINAAGGRIVSVLDGKSLEYNKQHLKNSGFITISSEYLWKRIRSKFSF